MEEEDDVDDDDIEKEDMEECENEEWKRQVIVALGIELKPCKEQTSISMSLNCEQKNRG